MPDTRIRSMRALARELGVSHATVSDALRNNPRVRRETRERVQSAAKALGYNYNPLAGAVMSEIRRSAVGAFRGTTAVVDLEVLPERPPHAAPYHELVLRGAREAAERLGFRVDNITLRDPHRSLIQLDRILEARGIRAVLFLPMFATPHLSGMHWERLAAIYTDYVITDPPIHRCCPDHFVSMTVALEKLIGLGYKRPGLVLQERQDRRTLFRWEAGFISYWGHHHGHGVTTPLVMKTLDRRLFEEWFQATKPDVVIAHGGPVLQWMIDLGCEIPETHGFCCLNVVTAGAKVAGLDLLPRLGGSRAMEALIAQLLRNEFGVPERPLMLTYAAKWEDGPTLRPQ